jgi:hypothetical protein
MAAAAGCSGSPPGAGPTSSAIEHPDQPDELILKVETKGGLDHPGADLSAVPDFLLYGDGRFLSLKPLDPNVPEPAIRQIEVRKVTRDGIQALLEAAKEAGLTGRSTEFGKPGLTDVGTTSFTLHADGRTYTRSVYALTTENGLDELPAEVRERRLAVRDFYNRLAKVQDWLPRGSVSDPTPYQYDKLMVFSFRENDLPAGRSPLPISRGLVDSGKQVDAGARCNVVEGEDMESWLEAAPDTAASAFTDGDDLYTVFLRPVLPGEKECPAA